jgi:hypothetical protein
MSKTPQARKKTTLRLVEKRSEEPQEAVPSGAGKRHFEDFIATTFARWRGHEPEIAILAATTFILTIAAIFAGADVLFTLLAAATAAVIIWSPWRDAA